MAELRAGFVRREMGIWDLMKRFGWGLGLGFWNMERVEDSLPASIADVSSNER